MHLAVILRLIPDLSEELEIDDSGTDIDREWIGFKLNEFDDQALEEAVLLKERFGAKVTAIALAAEGSDRILQTAVARGADEALRIDHDEERVDSAVKAASLLAGAFAEIGATLVLTGVQTPEDVFGQLAPTLAGRLGWPTVNAVSSVSVQDGKIVVRQEYSGGLSALLQVSGPAVLGIQAASQPPRYVSGTKLRQAQSTPIRSIRTDAAAASGAKISSLSIPERSSHAEMLAGDARSVAARVLDILRERGLAGA
jgi:electron transfer flavoprotein beta subunit